MWEYIEERARKNAEYIVQTGCTVRECAFVMGGSKSTVHKDVTERLFYIDRTLWKKVQAILGRNLKERAWRGGDATRRKYAQKRKREE